MTRSAVPPIEQWYQVLVLVTRQMRELEHLLRHRAYLDNDMRFRAAGADSKASALCRAYERAVLGGPTND
jgi:hypothetical protein